MDLSDISKINRARAQRWHAGGEEWHSSDWSNALAGEAGELQEAIEILMTTLDLGASVGRLCNMVKKDRRHETHVVQIAGGKGSYNTPPLDEIRKRIKNEIADVFLYLDLVSDHFGLSLEECIFPKFNEVSAAQGFPE